MGIDGEAFWSGNRVEGSGRLLNISAGGVLVADPKPLLPMGSQLHVSLVIGTRRIEYVPVEVAWASEKKLGLRFRKMRDDLQAEMDALLQDLTISR